MTIKATLTSRQRNPVEGRNSLTPRQRNPVERRNSASAEVAESRFHLFLVTLQITQRDWGDSETFNHSVMSIVHVRVCEVDDVS